MLDQLFTSENFRRIFDLENRRGNDLATKFFPKLSAHTDAIKKKKHELREFRKKNGNPAGDTGAMAKEISALKEAIKTLKSEKSAAITTELEEIAKSTLKPSFKISLTAATGPDGKMVYHVNEGPEPFFVVKQLQNNVRRLYQVKQADRHDLVAQLRSTLQQPFPLELVRTDIISFYENINRQKLLRELEQDHRLSPAARKYIKQILDSYGVLSGSSTGIPRGVGISAYLSELYLRSLDRDIRSIPGIILYCRYVDDIVAVFTQPIAGTAGESYEEKITKLIEKSDLKPNPTKTASTTLPSAAPCEFEYLGYKFVCSTTVSIAPSSKKLEKYRLRLEASFEQYHKQTFYDPRGAYRHLKARIKFITGNAHLVNSKAGAAVGVYFSNSLADDIKDFEQLDALLKANIAKVKSPKLRKALKECSFAEGFTERRFHNFNTKDLQRIVAAWKHG